MNAKRNALMIFVLIVIILTQFGFGAYYTSDSDNACRIAETTGEPAPGEGLVEIAETTGGPAPGEGLVEIAETTGEPAPGEGLVEIAVNEFEKWAPQLLGI